MWSVGLEAAACGGWAVKVRSGRINFASRHPSTPLPILAFCGYGCCILIQGNGPRQQWCSREGFPRLNSSRFVVAVTESCCKVNKFGRLVTLCLILATLWINAHLVVFVYHDRWLSLSSLAVHIPQHVDRGSAFLAWLLVDSLRGNRNILKRSDAVTLRCVGRGGPAKGHAFRRTAYRPTAPTQMDAYSRTISKHMSLGYLCAHSLILLPSEEEVVAGLKRFGLSLSSEEIEMFFEVFFLHYTWHAKRLNSSAIFMFKTSAPVKHWGVIETHDMQFVFWVSNDVMRIHHGDEYDHFKMSHQLASRAMRCLLLNAIDGGTAEQEDDLTSIYLAHFPKQSMCSNGFAVELLLH